MVVTGTRKVSDVIIWWWVMGAHRELAFLSSFSLKSLTNVGAEPLPDGTRAAKDKMVGLRQRILVEAENV